jgi:hypothetical protein
MQWTGTTVRGLLLFNQRQVFGTAAGTNLSWAGEIFVLSEWLQTESAEGIPRGRRHELEADDENECCHPPRQAGESRARQASATRRR